MSDAARPHSDRYFTESRDHWWHQDYLGLLATRLELSRAKSVLEVGTGQGHFARALAPHFGAGFQFTGLDRESRSLAIARARCDEFVRERGLDGGFTFVEGAAESLPFPDDHFDLVCCQTLLIHLREPALGFAEMLRVCKPGGLLLAVEPNNLAGLQRLACGGPESDPELRLREARFILLCTRGKALLGLGWNHFGMELPRLFGALDDVRYYNNDRAWAVAPPYQSPLERAAIADLERSVNEGVFAWEREEARRYYLAGGGTVEAFEADYDSLLAEQTSELAEVRAEKRIELVAFAGLIAAGRKPRTR